MDGLVEADAGALEASRDASSSASARRSSASQSAIMPALVPIRPPVTELPATMPASARPTVGVAPTVRAPASPRPASIQTATRPPTNPPIAARDDAPGDATMREVTERGGDQRADHGGSERDEQERHGPFLPAVSGATLVPMPNPRAAGRRAQGGAALCPIGLSALK